MVSGTATLATSRGSGATLAQIGQSCSARRLSRFVCTKWLMSWTLDQSSLGLPCRLQTKRTSDTCTPGYKRRSEAFCRFDGQTLCRHTASRGPACEPARLLEVLSSSTFRWMDRLVGVIGRDCSPHSSERRAVCRRLFSSRRRHAGARLARARSEPLPSPGIGVPGQVTKIDLTTGAVHVLTGDGMLVIELASLDGQRPVVPRQIITSTRQRFGLSQAAIAAQITSFSSSTV